MNGRAPSRAASPDWIAEAVRKARDELLLFFDTALGFTRRPGRFAAAFVAGEQPALNPFARARADSEPHAKEKKRAVLPSAHPSCWICFSPLATESLARWRARHHSARP